MVWGGGVGGLGGGGGGGQSVQMETGVWGGVRERRVAQARLAWTSKVGTLHCLFNREQISKKIEAHQSFGLWWVCGLGVGGAAANVEEISNFVSGLLAEGFVMEQRMEQGGEEELWL